MEIVQSMCRCRRALTSLGYCMGCGKRESLCSCEMLSNVEQHIREQRSAFTTPISEHERVRDQKGYFGDRLVRAS